MIASSLVLALFALLLAPLWTRRRRALNVAGR